MKDMRDFVAVCEEKGLLKRITAEVDWNLELSHIAKLNEEEQGPALLFENIKGYDTPVITSVCTTLQRLAIIMGLPEDSTLTQLYNHWAEKAKISKSDDCKTILISTDENSAEIKIDEEKEKATLKIGDGRTHDLTVKKENDKLNIYFKPTYRNIKPIVKPFGDIGADKSHFVYGFMEEDLKNNRVTIKFKYQNILGESGSVGFISEPEFCEFIGLERVKMPGILLNSFEMLFSRRKRI